MKKIVFDEIKKLTSKKFDENSLISNLDIDSLDLLQLITEIENKLNIYISDEELLEIKTISDVIKILESKKNN
ncbi:phosphopantetheine-binding protein [[Mycoplasma] collis]|uniref:phosphopantetheine-binding protein n=1 Tax=[Mycoplasma] collis TaxID=2127 RepID=UPI00051B74D3|nr:phosphopantetheine-binding protein [[Mycoplasma] collis]